MTFWIIACVMVLAGLVLLAPALVSKKARVSDDHREQNITIARERSRELQAELDAGIISEASYQQAVDELENNLLRDVETQEPGEGTGPGGVSGKLTLMALVILVPLLGFGLYHELGSPQYLQVSGPGVPAAAQAPASGHPGKIPSIEEMITGLNKKTKENPKDPNGWYLLGRLYASIQKFEASVAAYEKLVEVSDRQPTALVVLADSLAMTQGGNLEGRPIKLITEALEKDPQHTTALWMAGQEAADRKDYLAAISYWQKALPGLQENREMQSQLQAMIGEAVQLAKQAGLDVSEQVSPVKTVEDKAGDVQVSVLVSVDNSLLSEIRNTDLLFVFARAVSGPPMPVAALKLPADNFPKTLHIDNSSLLRPGKTLDQYGQLKLQARISHSGQPIGQSGDLESEPVVVKTDSNAEISLTINQRHP